MTYDMVKLYNQDCPVARALDIIGDRWTILIIRDLLIGRARFNEFLASSPGLPPKLLSDRLKRLEKLGIVERVLYSQHPLRAEYRLTDKGRTLQPVLETVFRWGIEHCFEGTPQARAALTQRFADALSTP